MACRSGCQGTDQADSVNFTMQLLDLDYDGVGELVAFLRGRLHRSVQQSVVIVVCGSGDVPFSFAPVDAVLARVR